MDYYHTPEVFARRISYKSPWWKEYFGKDKWIDSANVADKLNIFTKNDDISLPKIIHNIEVELFKDNVNTIMDQKQNIFELKNQKISPCKIVKVKMFDTSPKKQVEPIYIDNKNVIRKVELDSPLSEISENSPTANNQLTSTILESTQELNRINQTPKTSNSNQKCIFQENSVKPLSPIPLIKSPCKTPVAYKQSRKSIRSSFRDRIKKTPSKSKQINYPENQPESEIIKNLVLDRFISNIESEAKKYQLVKESERSSMRTFKAVSKNPFDYEFNNKIRKVRDIIAQYEQCNNEQDNNPEEKKEIAKINVQESEDIIQDPEDFNNSNKTTDDNSECNLADNEESCVDKNSIVNTTKFSEIPSYDPNKFLEEALGDEQYTSYSDTFSDSTLHIQNVHPSKRNLKSIEDFSICTGEASQLLTDRETPSPLVSFETTDDSIVNKNSSWDTSDVDKKIMDLIQQSAEQHLHMLQATKALNICNGTNKFANKNVEIEAEKFLLLADIKHRAILEEIKRIDNGETQSSNQRGTITISNLRIPLSFTFLDPMQKKLNDMKQFFLCVCSSGTQVIASNVVPIGYGDNIIFNDTITFTNLNPDFTINITIYCFEQPKFYHNTEENSCPSPKSFFKKHICKPLSHSRHLITNNIRSSSFKCLGTTKLDMKALKQPNPYKLENVHFLYLKGEIYCYIEKSVKFLISHRGFLTIGSEAGGYPSWSRFWCVLEDHYLKYWNYPAEREIKDPIGVINLKNCITSWIDKVDGNICSRPRTILLETFRDKKPNDRNSIIVDCKDNYTVIRHLLACDSDKDVKEWCIHLNNVVSYLRNWDII